MRRGWSGRWCGCWSTPEVLRLRRRVRCTSSTFGGGLLGVRSWRVRQASVWTPRPVLRASLRRQKLARRISLRCKSCRRRSRWPAKLSADRPAFWPSIAGRSSTGWMDCALACRGAYLVWFARQRARDFAQKTLTAWLRRGVGNLYSACRTGLAPSLANGAKPSGKPTR